MSRTSKRNLQPTISWALGAIFPLLLMNFAGLLYIAPNSYKRSLVEDGMVEWATALLFLAAGFVFLVLVVQFLTRHGTLRKFYLGMGLLLLFIFFEEINWGQRLLALESPVFFKRYGFDGQINLHNTLRVMTNISSGAITITVINFYWVVLPVLNLHPVVRSFLYQRGIVVPPAQMAPALLLVTTMHVTDWPTGDEDELAEMLYGVAFLLLAVVERLKLTASNVPGCRKTW